MALITNSNFPSYYHLKLIITAVILLLTSNLTVFPSTSSIDIVRAVASVGNANTGMRRLTTL